MDNSPLFIDILAGRRRMGLPEGFFLNDAVRHWLLYFLADGIYPRWAIFFCSSGAVTNEKETYAAMRQERVRKDVERLFGCLQGRFHILRGEKHELSDEIIVLITQICVILHNMIVVMKRSGEMGGEGDGVSLVEEFIGGIAPHDPLVRRSSSVSEVRPAAGLLALLDRVHAVQSEQGHVQLQAALIDHLWKQCGEQTAATECGRLMVDGVVCGRARRSPRLHAILSDARTSTPLSHCDELNTGASADDDNFASGVHLRHVSRRRAPAGH